MQKFTKSLVDDILDFNSDESMNWWAQKKDK
jgi:hypothetical protein